jgi:hypothetical protein
VLIDPLVCAAAVTYGVGTRWLTGKQDLGSDADDYHSGQHVTVYYDPDHPTHFTINGESNQPGWSVMLMIVAFVGGAFLTLGGIWTWMAWRPARRVLAQTSWHRAWAVVRRDRYNRVVVKVRTSGDAPLPDMQVFTRQA